MGTTKSFWFWVRRQHGGNYELIEIKARDSHAAVDQLPQCVSWDFSDGPRD